MYRDPLTTLSYPKAMTAPAFRAPDAPLRTSDVVADLRPLRCGRLLLTVDGRQHRVAGEHHDEARRLVAQARAAAKARG